MGALLACGRDHDDDDDLLLATGKRSRSPPRRVFRRSRRIQPSLEPSPASVVSFTHEGGAGGLDKENQDVAFTAQLSADVLVCAVFDGHGKRRGRVRMRLAGSLKSARHTTLDISLTLN